MNAYPILFALIYLSSFVYTVKVMLSPVYFLVPALLFVSLRSHRLNVFYVCILILLTMLVLGRGLPYAYFVNTFLGAICVIVALSSKTEIYSFAKTIKVFNVVLTGVFIFETYLRYTTFSGGVYGRYFNYKYESFMFADSNATAFAIFSILAVELYLIKERFRNTIIVSVLLYGLLLLTLSKTVIFFSTLMFFYHLKPKYLKYVVAFFIIFLLQDSIDYIEFYKNDPSVNVRLAIFTNFLDYLNQGSFSQLLFGSGWSDFRYTLYKDEPHSLIISIMGVGGLISLLVFMLLLTYVYISSNRFCKYYLSTILLSSVIYLPYYGLIFMYVSYAVLYIFEKESSCLESQ